MLISIISINLNNCKGLNDTFVSVFSQTFDNLDYVVIDGGSTDGSLELIKNHSHKINYFISERDTGIYNAMNKGVKVAKGNYLLFLNSGDTLTSSRVLEFIAPLLNNEDLIYGNINVKEDIKSWNKEYPSKLRFSYFLQDSLPHPATFIKKDLFEIIGLYSEENKIVSDWEFFLLAVNKYNCTYKHIPHTISNFDLDGISSRKESADLKGKEITTVLSKHFPSFLLDYDEMQTLKTGIQLLQHKYDLIFNSRVNRITRTIRSLFHNIFKI